jgi:hypothetical protein
MKLKEDSIFHIIISKEAFNKAKTGVIYRKKDKANWYKKFFGLLKDWERYFLLEYMMVPCGTSKVLVKEGTKYKDAPWGIQAEEIILLEYNEELSP